MILSHCDRCLTYTESDFNENCKRCGEAKEAPKRAEQDERPRAGGTWGIDGFRPAGLLR